MGAERYTPAERQFYRQYINSPGWRARKKARIAKAGGRCEFVIKTYTPGGVVETRCPRTHYLCVHHNTYARLGAEYDSDLDVLCWFHHQLEHLLWKRCYLCGQPALQNDEVASAWLQATLSAMQIDIDRFAIRWNDLPVKEVLLQQIPWACAICKPNQTKEDDG